MGPSARSGVPAGAFCASRGWIWRDAADVSVFTFASEGSRMSPARPRTMAAR